MMVLIDEVAAVHGQTRTLTRILKCGDVTVRIRVERNFYVMQSFAVFEVLAADRTWTNVTNAPASEWQAGTRSGDLAEVAENLAMRAERILTA